ncbi:UNVERIFIED_CONTAM: hypothetical protein RMT77_018826 [Armadillidium vulgare]
MADEGSDGWPSYGTNEDKEYRFRPIQGKSLRFRVKAPHDGHLSFSPVGEDTDDMFEVFIGAWENAASAIRFKKGDDLVKVDTPDILHGDEVREFWVTFDDDHVRVGRGGEWVPFMEATLPEHLDVAFYGYSTGWGAIGWWQFYHERVLHTEDCDTYNYQPIYGTSLVFSVSCGNDAHIALTSGPEDTEKMYEIFLGGWENQKSAIRLNKDRDQTVTVVETPSFLCADDEKTFYITFKDGVFRVGQQGNLEPFMEYTHTEPYKITHYGYCTAWGATGKWKLEL